MSSTNIHILLKLKTQNFLPQLKRIRIWFQGVRMNHLWYTVIILSTHPHNTSKCTIRSDPAFYLVTPTSHPQTSQHLSWLLHACNK